MKQANQIVLFTNDKNADALLINTLVKHYQKITVVQSIKELVTHLKEETPKVLLASGEKFQDTLTTFYSAIDKVSDDQLCEHFFVSLVSRHDEAEAYDAYRNGIIDDYLVARPLYEIHRPIVICEHLLIELGVAKDEKPGLEHIYQEEKYADDVRTLVAKGLERKEEMKQQLETAVNAIELALDNAAEKIQQNQPAPLDLAKLQQTLAQIKSDDIRPELLKLQSKALSLLQEVVQDSKEVFAPKAKDDDDALPEPPQQFHNKFQQQQANPNLNIDIPKLPEKIKILLVEDDPISIHVTSQIINQFNVELDTAFTGRRALACLKTNDYDLIFLDINLPDTNGMFLLDQIKKSNNNANAATVMLTGNRQKKTAVECINLGAKSYVVKPLQKSSFEAICEKLKLSLLKKAS